MVHITCFIYFCMTSVLKKIIVPEWCGQWRDGLAHVVVQQMVLVVIGCQPLPMQVNIYGFTTHCGHCTLTTMRTTEHAHFSGASWLMMIMASGNFLYPRGYKLARIS